MRVGARAADIHGLRNPFATGAKIGADQVRERRHGRGGEGAVVHIRRYPLIDFQSIVLAATHLVCHVHKPIIAHANRHVGISAAKKAVGAQPPNDVP